MIGPSRFGRSSRYGLYSTGTNLTDTRGTFQVSVPSYAGSDFPCVYFDGAVAQRYVEYGQDPHTGPGRQIWHTPTELFKVGMSRRHKIIVH